MDIVWLMNAFFIILSLCLYVCIHVRVMSSVSASLSLYHHPHHSIHSPICSCSVGLSSSRQPISINAINLLRSNSFSNYKYSNRILRFHFISMVLCQLHAWHTVNCPMPSLYLLLYLLCLLMILLWIKNVKANDRRSSIYACANQLCM